MFKEILLKIYIKFAKLIGSIRIEPEKRKLYDMKKYIAITKFIKKGDIVLTRKKGELSNLFIPGYWKHAAIYCGDCEIIEAIGLGVRKIGLFDFMKDKDYICILTPTYRLKKEHYNYLDIFSAYFVETANKCVGKKYDYFFNPSEKEFYCSELVAHCYNETLKKNVQNPWLFETKHAFGVKTVFPQDFYNASSSFELIYENGE